VIPAGVRFQVEYPTPLASISGYIVPEQQQALLDSYERAMFADLDRLLAAIPADEVAVPRLGCLHRMRDGPREPGRGPGAAGPAPGDHHRPIANRYAAVVRITPVHLPLRSSGQE
jgi:hypothetical protein